MEKTNNPFIFASNNLGKFHEIEPYFQKQGLILYSQTDYAITEVAETGLTFLENALIKARHASSLSGLPAIADDSGLCVDALKGAPGIYSARYAEGVATDQTNNQKLLTALRDIPYENRTARFCCALVCLKNADDPFPRVALGVWEGVIAFKECGTQGFGYDPIFVIPALGKTAAELTPHEKFHLSHRGQAVVGMLKQF